MVSKKTKTYKPVMALIPSIKLKAFTAATPIIAIIIIIKGENLKSLVISIMINPTEIK